MVLFDTATAGTMGGMSAFLFLKKTDDDVQKARPDSHVFLFFSEDFAPE